MATYILRRILWMIPTLLAICLIVFVIINLAPGTPGEIASAQGEESADESESRREAYRIFKEQFDLDKPILINFHYTLSEADVLDYVTKIANVSGNVSMKDMIKADENLEDYGRYAVPHLVSIIQNTKDEEIRRVAAKKFSENARARLFRAYRNLEGRQALELKDTFDKENPNLMKSKGEETYQLEVVAFINRNMNEQNRTIRGLWYSKKASTQEKDRVVSEISKWYQNNKQWFETTWWQKLQITFLETRFVSYCWNLAHLDFGISHVDRQPVLRKVLSKLKYSITLSLFSLLLSYFLAVPLGIYSAVKQHTVKDELITLILFMLYSLPSYFAGTLLLRVFSEGGDYWRIFPTGGFQDINYMKFTSWEQIVDIGWHIILPTACLTYQGLASLSRYARAGLLDIIRADYIKTARAKGLPEYLVILRHAVRNGMIPVLTLLASLLPVLIGGSVVIEVIFGIDGMGYLTVAAITARDYNTIMCVTLLSAVLTMIGILLSDISYALADPRITFK